jgi:peptidoglycan-associated lipoprotein
MNTAKTCVILLCSAVLLAACSSTPTTPAPTASMATAAPTAPTTPKPTAGTMAPTSLPAHLDPKSAISTDRSVYFDFDDYSIKKEYGPLIERHGRYLASNPRLAIRIEGNADDRGSAEYNLALGQKRAETVLRALKIYGVKDSQMEAISWGKEKPKSTGHDEAAWAQNRRADLEYPKK